MSSRAALIADAEKSLRQARSAFDAGAINISRTEVDKGRYKTDLQNTPWAHFVSKADYSYFVARILLAQGIQLYGLFCAHQCVEVYLKALLRKAGVSIPQTHKLLDVLRAARMADPTNTSFLHEADAETICLRFEPFYEIARYPAQISRPEGGSMWASGVDEKFIDYFVYQMRQLLVLPAGSWDILSSLGHQDLEHVSALSAQAQALFTRDNLNCVN